MKKFGLVLAAIGALAIAAPSMANAETVVIKRSGVHDHGHHYGHKHRGTRAEIRVHSDRGLHRGWRNRNVDKVVIIKKRRHHHHHHD